MKLSKKLHITSCNDKINENCSKYENHKYYDKRINCKDEDKCETYKYCDKHANCEDDKDRKPHKDDISYDKNEKINQIFTTILRNDFISFLHKTFNTLHPEKTFNKHWYFELLIEYLYAAECGLFPQKSSRSSTLFSSEYNVQSSCQTSSASSASSEFYAFSKSHKSSLESSKISEFSQLPSQPSSQSFSLQRLIRPPKRIIINIPPRSLKSICISVAWSTWLLGHHPQIKIIAISYSQLLSNKHNNDCRKIMQSEWYQRCFPETQIVRGENTKNKFVTTKHGFRFATSLGGTLTGEGADVIIVDDPQTPKCVMSTVERARNIEWFSQTLLSRLNDRDKGVIILVMQRLHTDDLTGHLVSNFNNNSNNKNKNDDKYNKNGDETGKNGWHHVTLPLVAHDDSKNVISFGNFSYTRAIGEVLYNVGKKLNVTELKSEVGTYVFETQYQQSPMSINSDIIQHTWISKYNITPQLCARTCTHIICQSWDCAIKTTEISDYSVCTTWGIDTNAHKYYLLDVMRVKVQYPALRRAIIDMYGKFNSNIVLIEDKASGQQLIQELTESKTSINIVKYQPKYDKVTRLVLVSTLFEAGRVLLPQAASWLDEYESELMAFPRSKHDDQVDSTTQFLLWVTQTYNMNAKSREIEPRIRLI